MNNTNHFKKCPNCGFIRELRDDFLNNANLELIGYQVSFLQLSTGSLLFNHSCSGTLAMSAKVFEDMNEGPMFQKRYWGMDKCLEYCLYRDELSPCPNEWECASIRKIIQIIWEGQRKNERTLD